MLLNALLNNMAFMFFIIICDNGCFADRAFVQEVHKAQHTIPFCGIGVHHQNGIAEQ